MITWENYEEYIMMYADGELSPAEESALLAFVSARPELQKELDLYSRTKLAPDTTQVYAAKDALLQPAEKKVVAFPVWVKYSIAAGIAAILFITLFRHTGTDDTTVAVKQTDTATKTMTTPATPAVAVKENNKEQSKEQPAPDQTPATPVAKVKEQIVLAAVRKTVKHNIGNNDRHTTPAQQEVAQSKTATAGTDINALPIAAAQKIHIQKELPSAIAETEVPEYVATQTETTTGKRTFWDRLPIKESGKQELQAIASAISGTYDQVNDAKTSIEQTKLTVRVEKRKLMISF